MVGNGISEPSYVMVESTVFRLVFQEKTAGFSGKVSTSIGRE